MSFRRRRRAASPTAPLESHGHAPERPLDPFARLACQDALIRELYLVIGHQAARLREWEALVDQLRQTAERLEASLEPAPAPAPMRDVPAAAPAQPRAMRAAASESHTTIVQYPREAWQVLR